MDTDKIGFCDLNEDRAHPKYKTCVNWRETRGGRPTTTIEWLKFWAAVTVSLVLVFLLISGLGAWAQHWGQ